MTEVFMIIALFGSHYVADLSGWTSRQECEQMRARYEAIDERHEVRCVTREQMASERTQTGTGWR